MECFENEKEAVSKVRWPLLFLLLFSSKEECQTKHIVAHLLCQDASQTKIPASI